MNIEALLAKRIRDKRTQNDLTLARLSEMCGVSISMLSKIENAKVSSPVSVYARIARALDIPLGKLFFENDHTTISIVRKEERKKYTQSPAYIGESIAHKMSNKKMEPFIHTYKNGCTNPPLYRHNNEELIFVLQGTLEFRYGEETFVLNPGDCVYYDASVDHTARSLGDDTAQAIIVET